MYILYKISNELCIIELKELMIESVKRMKVEAYYHYCKDKHSFFLCDIKQIDEWNEPIAVLSSLVTLLTLTSVIL
jgi:hypothetical protein